MLTTLGQCAVEKLYFNTTPHMGNPTYPDVIERIIGNAQLFRLARRKLFLKQE